MARSVAGFRTRYGSKSGGAVEDGVRRYLGAASAEWRMVHTPLMTCRELTDFIMAYLDGELPPGERAAFEHRADFDALLELRRADDAAKEPGRVVLPLERWRATVDDLASVR